MKIEKIVWEAWSRPQDCNYLWTIDDALAELCYKYNLGWETRENSFWQDIQHNYESNSPHLLFWNLGLEDGWERFTEYKKKCPNSVIVTMSGDSHYWPYLEDYDWSGIDLHLDCCLHSVNRIGKIIPTKFLWWTISENCIKKCERGNNKINKVYDGLCLFRPNHYREQLWMACENKGLRLCTSPDVWDSERVFDLYRKSYCHLDTTNAVYGDGHPRSQKGFRWALGPFLDCPTVLDDMDEFLHLEGSIFPLYPYNDFKRAAELVEILKTSVRDEFIFNQKEWILAHTIDKQLEKIFLERGWLSGQ